LSNPEHIEQEIRSRPVAEAGPVPPLAETQQVLHDLRVHQIELELQNEELRRTQLELEAARARYFDLYDLAPVAYFTLSQTGMIQEANFAAASLLKRPRGDLVQHPFTRFILPADQDIYYRHRKQLLEAGGQLASEFRMVTSDGDPRWVRLEATAVKDAFGAVVLRAVVSDIDARKHAEQTLVASEARHRTLFEKSHDGLMTLAPPDWQFTSGNSTTVALFGARDERDFVSHPPSKYSPKRQPDGSLSIERTLAAIEIALSEGSHYYEWTFKRLSGEEFPATVLLTRVELDGHPMLQATVRDETDVNALRAMLGQQDRLASMGMLAAGVAHEINNPLANVLYNIETLAGDLPKLGVVTERCMRTLRSLLAHDAIAAAIGDDAAMLETTAMKDLAERAREALGSTQRIRTISKAIGTFSRVESSERSRIDLNYVIQCAATIAQNDIKFRCKLVADYGQLPAIWASEGKLSQVFLNLLINAAQAIGDGDVQHGEIHVRTWVEGENAFAEVKDNGKGITREALRRIFEPFFTTKAVGVGSGLGLAICRNIITEFGGDISVESEVGVSTRFLIRLPVRQGASTAPRDHATSEAPPASSVRGRILVVDDEPGIRTMMVRMLGRDHEVVTADSAVAARNILGNDPAFDVILCDLMMQDMTGMELHGWLATHRPALADRVVFVTGGAFTPKASEYVERVGNPRVEKPFEPAKLKQLLLEMIALARTTPGCQPA